MPNAYLSGVDAFLTLSNTNLGGQTSPVPAAYHSPVKADTQVQSKNPAVAFVQLASAAQRNDGSEKELFNKIIIQPRSVDVSFVLSDTQFSITIWNSFFNTAKRIETVDITGPAGVSINASAPISLAPSSYATYTALVSVTGDTIVDNVINFNIPGVPGTTVAITGSRMTVWPIPPNWDSGYSMKYSYATGMITSYNSREQRIQNRSIPDCSLTYTIGSVDENDSAYIASLLYGWQARIFATPLWTEAQALNSAVAVGDTTVFVTTADRDYVVGEFIMLWKDIYTYEAQQITSILADRVTVARAFRRAWDATLTQAVAMRFGYMDATVTTSNDSATISDAQVTFNLELVK